jgi:hypothetical protein
MIEFLKRVLHGKRIVYGGEYLTRFYLWGNDDRTRYNVYLHRIFKPDGERKPHNHPWPWFVSFILTGWYDEVRDSFEAAAESAPKRHRWINIMPSPAVFHRITRVSKRPVWTLVIVPPKDERDWGFLERGCGPQGSGKWLTSFVKYKNMTLEDGVSTEEF